MSQSGRELGISGLGPGGTTSTSTVTQYHCTNVPVKMRQRPGGEGQLAIRSLLDHCLCRDPPPSHWHCHGGSTVTARRVRVAKRVPVYGYAYVDTSELSMNTAISISRYRPSFREELAITGTTYRLVPGTL